MKGKRFIVGITASIAAYKTASLVRLLIKEGAEVKVVMTKLAKELITPLTMATLSKNPIMVEFYNPENGDWNSHVDLGLWADAMIIAPVTANTMGKMANGIADNLLLTTYLSAKCPVFFAPAMDLDMYKHPTTQKNIKILQSFGNICIEPGSGELASGLSGKGRMEEPDKIVERIKEYFAKKEQFTGKTFLITAGPTHEPIDPVRFIGNHSSGKMGYAIATEIAERGGLVKLVSGPVSINIEHPNIELIKVNTAQQMYEQCAAIFPNVQVGIMAAAVADYTPVFVANQKIKKDSENIILELKKNVDIAKELGALKQKNQILVGFALETENETENAKQKISKKNFDFIVLNSMNDEGAGFRHDTNKITIIEKSGKTEKHELKAKKAAAADIANKIYSYIET